MLGPNGLDVDAAAYFQERLVGACVFGGSSALVPEAEKMHRKVLREAAHYVEGSEIMARDRRIRDAGGDEDQVRLFVHNRAILLLIFRG